MPGWPTSSWPGLRRRDLFPQLRRKAARIDGEDLPRDGGLLALALPVVDHRVLVPDHRERNDLGVGLARAEFAHGLARRHLLVRLAADRAVALHASQDLAAHAAPHDGAGGIDLGLLLRLELVLAVERGDHPVRHGGPGVARIGRIDIADRLTVGDGIGERLVGGLAGTRPSTKSASAAPGMMVRLVARIVSTRLSKTVSTTHSEQRVGRHAARCPSRALAGLEKSG